MTDAPSRIPAPQGDGMRKRDGGCWSFAFLLLLATEYRRCGDSRCLLPPPFPTSSPPVMLALAPS